MTTLNALVLPGDGIGPEVVREAVALLEAVTARGGPAFNLEYAAFGGAAIDAGGTPMTDETLRLARAADAVLLGAVGGPKWDGLPSDRRPERGLLGLRAGLDAYCNLRPAKLFAALADASPLSPARAGRFDFVVVRELTGDVYFGEPRGSGGVPPSRRGVNTMAYREDEIRRIGVAAFELARRRAKRLTSVDKANVLEVMALWRAVMTEIAAGYPDVALSHMYVDNCAMQLVLNPCQFDVLVCGNLFGDIISDEAGALTGSIGMLPSASIGDRGAIYEPVHGSAPDIAGRDLANPLAMILSVAMMLEHTAKRGDLARLIDRAVDVVLEKGLRTSDILGPAAEGVTRVGTRAMGQAVVGEFSRLA